MILKGTVRNVIDFGVFVDIGVHQDGLVHISQITDRYIKHPLEAVSVGDIVDVQVLTVDMAKKRIGLTQRSRSGKNMGMMPGGYVPVVHVWYGTKTAGALPTCSNTQHPQLVLLFLLLLDLRGRTDTFFISTVIPARTTLSGSDGSGGCLLLPAVVSGKICQSV